MKLISARLDGPPGREWARCMFEGTYTAIHGARSDVTRFRDNVKRKVNTEPRFNDGPVRVWVDEDAG